MQMTFLNETFQKMSCMDVSHVKQKFLEKNKPAKAIKMKYQKVVAEMKFHYGCFRTHLDGTDKIKCSLINGMN